VPANFLDLPIFLGDFGDTIKGKLQLNEIEREIYGRFGNPKGNSVSGLSPID
jgi:hypothetical protein